jgi:hypothetical protein
MVKKEGFFKVHVKKDTYKILGAPIVGHYASEPISESTVAANDGMGLRYLATVIHPYPAEAEALRKVANAYNHPWLTPIGGEIPAGDLSGDDKRRSISAAFDMRRPVH